MGPDWCGMGRATPFFWEIAKGKSNDQTQQFMLLLVDIEHWIPNWPSQQYEFGFPKIIEFGFFHSTNCTVESSRNHG